MQFNTQQNVWFYVINKKFGKFLFIVIKLIILQKIFNLKEQPPPFFPWQEVFLKPRQEVWEGYVTRGARKGSQRAWKSLVRSSREPTFLDDFESKQLARDNKSPAERVKRIEGEFKGSYHARMKTRRASASVIHRVSIAWIHALFVVRGVVFFDARH